MHAMLSMLTMPAARYDKTVVGLRILPRIDRRDIKHQPPIVDIEPVEVTPCRKRNPRAPVILANVFHLDQFRRLRAHVPEEVCVYRGAVKLELDGRMFGVVSDGEQAAAQL